MNDALWTKTFGLLREYINTHNELPRRGTVYGEGKPNLYCWVNQQRKAWRAKTMEGGSKAKLEALDRWEWEPALHWGHCPKPRAY